jgi:hypothetical protein
MRTILLLILILSFAIPLTLAIQDPYPLGGYVKYPNGTVAKNANITFTNQNTSEVIYDDSSPTTGWYSQDAANFLTDYEDGHIINYHTVLGGRSNDTSHIIDVAAGGNVMDIILGEEVLSITLNAYEYGLLRVDASVDQNLTTIAATIDNDICFMWWNATSDEWMSHYSGDSYNAGADIPKNVSYFVLVSTETEIECVTAVAESVTMPVGWFSTLLRESTTHNLSTISSSMGVNVTDLFAWDNSSYEWNNTGSFDVLPNQGVFANSSQAFDWDGSVT